MNAADFPRRPWRVDYAQGIIDADEIPIAYMMGPESSYTPHPVASMFAAAPDMLDALKRIAAYGNDGVCPYGCDTPDIARAAIQRAEGGAS